MPNVDDQLLVKTWQDMDISNGFADNKCSHLVLSHWISRGKVKKATSVRNTFEASSFYTRSQVSASGLSFARLLLALDKHREMCLRRMKDLFDLLHRVGRFRQVSFILSRLEELGLKITVPLLASSVEKMSAYDRKRALDMYHFPFHLRIGYPLRPDFIPDFIISLVNDPQIPPGAIWKLLKIPIYEGGPSFQPHFARPLPQTMINLVHEMAIAFADSDARPPRVALRNILQRLHHLRIHRAPISPELTRAISHVAITRSIIEKRLVGQERLRYAVSLIAEVREHLVADDVAKTVFILRQHSNGKQARQRRESNPLRVGPIN